MYPEATFTKLEELLASCKPFVERLARRFARISRSPLLEFDDYVSVAMLKLCEVADSILSAHNPVAYGHEVAGHAMIAEYHALHCQCPTISLDAPLCPDQDFCLVDFLSDHANSFPVPPCSAQCAHAVRDALGRLDAPQRDALSYRYGFEGYGSSASREVGSTLGISPSRARWLATEGRETLRQDEALCTAVGGQG